MNIRSPYVAHAHQKKRSTISTIERNLSHRGQKALRNFNFLFRFALAFMVVPSAFLAFLIFEPMRARNTVPVNGWLFFYAGLFFIVYAICILTFLILPNSRLVKRALWSHALSDSRATTRLDRLAVICLGVYKIAGLFFFYTVALIILMAKKDPRYGWFFFFPAFMLLSLSCGYYFYVRPELKAAIDYTDRLHIYRVEIRRCRVFVAHCRCDFCQTRNDGERNDDLESGDAGGETLERILDSLNSSTPIDFPAPAYLTNNSVPREKIERGAACPYV